MLLAGPLALALAGHWRVAWLCFAVLTVAATVVTVRAAGSLGPEPAAPTASRPAGPSLRPAVLAALLAGAGSAAVWTFGRDLVVSAGELTPLTSTLFWVLLGAAGVTGAVAGDAVQRWDVARAWAAFALLLAAATTGLALAPGVVVVAFGCGAAFGGSYVALSGVVIAWGTQLRPDAPGKVNAVLFLTLAAGQALGALLVGGLADLVGLPVAFLVAAGLVTASCVPAARRGRHTNSPPRRPVRLTSAG